MSSRPAEVITAHYGTSIYGEVSPQFDRQYVFGAEDLTQTCLTMICGACGQVMGLSTSATSATSAPVVGEVNGQTSALDAPNGNGGA